MSKPWLFVMAGGAGTRFWPKSRAKKPKQLMPMGGRDSLLRSTVTRFADLVPQAQIVILTTEALQAAVREDLAGLNAVQVLGEPVSKNTAPSVVMAMEWLRSKDPKATAIFVPADHWISEVPEYLRVMQTAVKAANEHQALCTIGIQPTRPETGFGYIHTGSKVAEYTFRVDRFVEKPAREVAETMIQSPDYLWNAGMFVWTVESFFREMGVTSAELLQSFSGYRAALAKGGDSLAAMRDSFQKAPAISIDYALMEKSKTVMVIPGSSFGWNDLGSFVSLEEIYPKQEGGTAVAKRVIAIDSLANIVDAPGKTVALLGVTNMVIVDTGDVLLIADKERCQDVKKFVERLRAEKKEELL